MTLRRRDEVTETLRERIVSGLHTGRLRGGHRLPSVRTLAAELDVNERVVLAAMRALAADGIVHLKERSGAYVAVPHAPRASGLPQLGAWLIEVLLQARSRGLRPRALPEFVSRSIGTRRVRAACIECNLDQLHLLCTELADDHGFAAESTHLDTLAADDPPPSVRRADVLITTAFHADRVRRLAKTLGKPWIGVTLRPDVMRSVGQHLRRGPVYYVATDPRYERKLRRMLAPFGPTQNLRVCLVPRDDPDDIPRDAPTFIMTSAREYLTKHNGHRGEPGRPIQTARSFSDESARELLEFLVRANAEQAAMRA